jgi:Ulp1 family protease
LWILLLQNFSTYLIPGLIMSGGSLQLDWAERRNVTQKSIWFIPLNIRNAHWALAVVFLNHQQVIIIDSRTDGNFQDLLVYTTVLQFVRTVLKASGKFWTFDETCIK